MSWLRTESIGPILVVTLARPPHNYFDVSMLTDLADVVAQVDRTVTLRATVLRSEQRIFCAGADFGGEEQPQPEAIYRQAARLVDRRKPIVASIRGPAVGGGLGLALLADFRVGGPATRLHANFTAIGLSPGFGLTSTLTRLIGPQAARDLLLTARRVHGDEALALGLLDRLVSDDRVDDVARELAETLATNSPSALINTRLLLTRSEQDDFVAAIADELAQQKSLFASPDFAEGVSASAGRRRPRFRDSNGEER